MINLLTKLSRRFHRDERGQAMVVTAILAVVLVRSVAMSFNAGVAVSTRIRTQLAADMAAYSSAVWQARFLNYCAYSRRAIMANVGHIALCNALHANAEALEKIHDAKGLLPTIFTDTGDVKDHLDMFRSIRRQLVPDNPGNSPMELLNVAKVADHMNRLLALSQVSLFGSISPVENAIQEKILEDCNPRSSSQANAAAVPLLRLAEVGHAPLLSSFEIPGFGITTPFNLGVGNGQSLGVPDLPGLNMLSGLSQGTIERRRISLAEYRAHFDRGMTNFAFIPTHWGYFGIMGHMYTDAYVYTDCPGFKMFYITTINMLPPLSLTAPNFIDTDSTDTFVARPDYPIFSLVNPLTSWYTWFYLCFYIGPIRVNPIVSLPIIMFFVPGMYNRNTTGTDPAQRIAYSRSLAQLHVYEMRNGLAANRLEPSIYAAVAANHKLTPYVRLTNESNTNNSLSASDARSLGLLTADSTNQVVDSGDQLAHDIVAVARAKVYFRPPHEDYVARQGRRPNLNFPFWGAKLAPVRDGGAAGTLMFALRPPIPDTRSFFSAVMDMLGVAKPNY